MNQTCVNYLQSTILQGSRDKGDFSPVDGGDKSKIEVYSVCFSRAGAAEHKVVKLVGGR